MVKLILILPRLILIRQRMAQIMCLQLILIRTDLLMYSLHRKMEILAWYENDGSESFTKHSITTSASGGQSVHAIDMDNDGDIDVISASGNDNTISWYENVGSVFTKHDITSAASKARCAIGIDVDGDGDMDIVGASQDDDTIFWLENDSSQSFTKHDITTAANGAISVWIVDVDGDSRLDVVGVGRFETSVKWYENLMLSPPTTAPSLDPISNPSTEPSHVPTSTATVTTSSSSTSSAFNNLYFLFFLLLLLLIPIYSHYIYYNKGYNEVISILKKMRDDDDYQGVTMTNEGHYEFRSSEKKGGILVGHEQVEIFLKMFPEYTSDFLKYKCQKDNNNYNNYNDDDSDIIDGDISNVCGIEATLLYYVMAEVMVAVVHIRIVRIQSAPCYISTIA